MGWFKEQVQFSRIEILGLLGIVSIGMLGIVIQYIPNDEGTVYDIQLSDIMIDEEMQEFLEPAKAPYKKQTFDYNKKAKPTVAKPKIDRRVFDFDPNKVSADSLVMLGFRKYLAERWVKFRSAGKSFKELDDVLSIYGIDTSLVMKINEHILFPEKHQYHEGTKQKEYAISPDREIVEKKESDFSIDKKDIATKEEMSSEKILSIYDLNSCTKEDLLQVKGIGPKYASRIIKFRSILGGYSRKDQLLEVYGMTDSTYLSIKDQLSILSPPDKIRINTASQEQMADHYLFSYKMSKLIYAYREEHGAFVDGDAFKEIKGIEAAKIEKIIPYLDFAL